MYGMSVTAVVRAVSSFLMRVAPKNQSRSFTTGPPNVASYIGIVPGFAAFRSRFGSLAAGVFDRQ